MAGLTQNTHYRVYKKNDPLQIVFAGIIFLWIYPGLGEMDNNFFVTKLQKRFFV
jgi:hypothetical protein